MTRRCPYCDSRIVLRRNGNGLLVFTIHNKFVRGQGIIKCDGSGQQAEDEKEAAHP